jgi:DNA polymerase I-like protein with 3'-5' exonuclease and polymerase domains
MIRMASVNVMIEADKNHRWGLEQIMTVHDENVYIVRDEYVEEAMKVIRRGFLCATSSFSVPFDVEVSCGKTYADAK